MKIVRPIYLLFTGGVLDSTTAYVNVPFEVKFANVVSCAYFSGSTQNYNVVISSDFTDGQPLSIQTLVTPTPAVFSQSVLIEFPVPKIIQGNFKFYLTNAGTGLPIKATNNDTCGLIVEFYDSASYPAFLQEKTPFKR